MPKPILLHPINATFTLSDGATEADHTRWGRIVIVPIAEAAMVDFLIKLLRVRFIFVEIKRDEKIEWNSSQ